MTPAHYLVMFSVLFAIALLAPTPYVFNGEICKNGWDPKYLATRRIQQNSRILHRQFDSDQKNDANEIVPTVWNGHVIMAPRHNTGDWQVNPKESRRFSLRSLELIALENQDSSAKNFMTSGSKHTQPAFSSIPPISDPATDGTQSPMSRRLANLESNKNVCNCCMSRYSSSYMLERMHTWFSAMLCKNGRAQEGVWSSRALKIGGLFLLALVLLGVLCLLFFYFQVSKI